MGGVGSNKSLCGTQPAIHLFALIGSSNGTTGTECLLATALSKHMSLKINFDNVDLFVLSGMENIMYFKAYEARFQNVVGILLLWRLGGSSGCTQYVSASWVIVLDPQAIEKNDGGSFDLRIPKEETSVL